MKLNNDGTSKILNDILRLEVVDYQAGSGNLSYSYSAIDSANPSTNILRGLTISNDSSIYPLTITIGTITFTVLQTEKMSLDFPAFSALLLTGAGAWRLWLLQ